MRIYYLRTELELGSNSRCNFVFLGFDFIKVSNAWGYYQDCERILSTTDISRTHRIYQGTADSSCKEIHDLNL